MTCIHVRVAMIICAAVLAPPTLDTMSPNAPPSHLRRVALQVNTRAIDMTLPGNATLAEMLREHLQLRGTKVACDQAACGACTVLVDGEPVFACHTLAAQCQGSKIQTIEGLAGDAGLHPLQQAFIDHDAVQCGFCTPGMLMALKAALDRRVRPEREALSQPIAGNICRCGAYDHILEAALDVASSYR
jgi:xanthine dehydrogenase YagT iron-sulfur-binding subunit